MGELLIKEGHPYQGVAYNLDESGVLQGKEDYKLGILSESTFFLQKWKYQTKGGQRYPWKYKQDYILQ